MAEVNGYTLSRAWFDWYSSTSQGVTVSHAGLFYYLIEVWNTSGQRENFGLPTDHSISRLKISQKTYYKLINDLVEWGIINIVQESKNQNNSRVVRFGKFYLTNDITDIPSDSISDDISDIPSRGDIIEQENNKNNKKKRIVNSKTHTWANSPLKDLDSFTEAWIALGKIETSKQDYEPSHFDIRYYWLKAKSYGERNPNKKYLNWAKESSSWLVSNWEKGTEQPRFANKELSEPLPDSFNDIKQIASAAIGENYNWAKRVAKNNEEHTAILINMLEKEGVILIDGKFIHNG
jgi:hypothetical protein